jgi:hypothetical protein
MSTGARDGVQATTAANKRALVAEADQDRTALRALKHNHGSKM